MDYTIAESGQIEALCGEVGGLYERLKRLKDRRDLRRVRYPLAAVLMIMVLAKLSGEDEARGIAEWAKWRAKLLAKVLGLKRESMPHHTTYSRIMGHAVEVERFEAVVREYLSRHQPAEAHMALDGKARQGTIEPGHTQGVHLLAAYLPEVEVVVGQTAISITASTSWRTTRRIRWKGPGSKKGRSRRLSQDTRKGSICWLPICQRWR